MHCYLLVSNYTCFTIIFGVLLPQLSTSKASLEQLSVFSDSQLSAQAFAAAGVGKRKRADEETEEDCPKDKSHPQGQQHSDNNNSSTSSPSLDVVVREFLSSFADLPLPDMDPEAASAAAAQLLQKLESHAARLPGLHKLLAA